MAVDSSRCSHQGVRVPSLDVAMEELGDEVKVWFYPELARAAWLAAREH